ncbi:MAG: nuclear transport factor 2 family protein, partial [Gemmatimonadaceae bacterium]
MQRSICALTFAALISASTIQAQSAEEDVLKTVRQLFDGMRKGDCAMVRAAFHPDAILQTTGVRNGQTVVGKVSID